MSKTISMLLLSSILLVSLAAIPLQNASAHVPKNIEAFVIDIPNMPTYCIENNYSKIWVDPNEPEVMVYTALPPDIGRCIPLEPAELVAALVKIGDENNNNVCWFVTLNTIHVSENSSIDPNAQWGYAPCALTFERGEVISVQVIITYVSPVYTTPYATEIFKYTIPQYLHVP